MAGCGVEVGFIFKYFYTNSGYRTWAIDYVCNNQGDISTAGDIFQECVILLDRNIRENRFERNSSIRTYFYGIVKQYWFNQRRKMNKVVHQEIPENHDQGPSIEDIIHRDEMSGIINKILEKIGEQCKKILSLYKLSLSNSEIAIELNLSSPEMAKKYNYRCREKFKAYVMQRTDIMNLLSIK